MTGPSRARPPALLALALLALGAGGCTDNDEVPTTATLPQAPATLEAKTSPDGPVRASKTSRFPAVAGIEITRARGQSFDIALTVSSPYDSPDRYADGWKVETPSGRLLGEKRLFHDHADEQPFTRVQEALPIPLDVQNIVIQAHDSVNGYGGPKLTVELR